MHSMLIRAAARTEDVMTIDVWSSVFGLEEESKFSISHRVASRLNLLYEELQLLVEQLRRSGAPERLWVGHLNSVLGAISVHQLSSPWGSGKSFLKPETLVALEFCSQLLPNDEDDIDEEELLQLSGEVNSLLKLLEASTLPESLRHVIVRNLNDIRLAIEHYRLIGAKAFKPPLDSSMADVYRAKDQIRENAQTPEISSFRAILETLDRLASAVGNYEKVVGIANRVGGYLADLMK